MRSWRIPTSGDGTRTWGGSATTVEVYLRRLNLFCRQNEYTPVELVKLGKGDKKRLQDLLLDQVTWMEDERYSPGYFAGIVR